MTLALPELSGHRPVSPRLLAPFAALSAAYCAHIGFFIPYLSLWLKDLGYTVAIIGVLVSLQACTRLYAPYLWGWLSDHTGQRARLLQISAGIALICSFGLAHHSGPVWLAVVLLLMFTHTSSMMPMSEAALTQLVSHSGVLDARRYGRIRLWGSMGFLASVLAAGWWFDRHGMTDFVFWTWGTLLLLNFSVWSIKNTRETHAKQLPAPAMMPELRRPHNMWFFVTLFFHVLTHIPLYSFYSLYLDGLGYSKMVIGALWALSLVVEIWAFLTLGRWLHWFSLSRWILICAWVLLLRMVLIASSNHPFGLLVLALAQVLHLFTFAVHHSVVTSWLTQHFTPRLRGRAQALYATVGYGATGILGSLGGGLLSQHFGLSAVFWLAVPIAMLTVFSAWWLHHLAHEPQRL